MNKFNCDRNFIKFGYLLIVFWIWYLLLPNIDTISDGLDPSWMSYIAYAFQHKLILGRDSVWTYGVLGQVRVHQYSSLYWLFISFAGFLNLLVCFFSVRLLGWVKGIVLLLVISLANYNYWGNTLFIFYIFMFSYLYLNFKLNKLERICIVLGIVIISHIKISFLVMVAIPLVIMVMNKQIIDVIASIILYFVIWSIYNIGNLGGIGNFFLYSKEIMSGYNVAMSNFSELPYDYNNIYAMINIVLFLISGLICYALDKKWRNVLLVFLLGFISYKESIVRADAHSLCGAYFQLILCTFFILKYGVNARNILINAVSIILSSFIIVSWGVKLPPLLQSKYYDQLRQQQQYSLLNIKEKYNFPEVSGCSDIYPYDISALIASGNNLCIRPVFQSYSAYTERLLQLNYQHLQGTSAPNNIFWAISPIDNRYTSLDDSISWLQIMSKYSLNQILSSQYVLLQLESEPITYSINKKIGINELSLNHFVDISKIQGLVWVKFDMHTSWLERIISLVYKPNQINLKLKYSDGSHKEFRIIPEIARSGFILSPSIFDNNDFICLYTSNNNDKCGKKVLSFAISTPHDVLASMYSIYNVEIEQINFSSSLKYNKNIARKNLVQKK